MYVKYHDFEKILQLYQIIPSYNPEYLVDFIETNKIQKDTDKIDDLLCVIKRLLSFSKSFKLHIITNGTKCLNPTFKLCTKTKLKSNEIEEKIIKKIKDIGFFDINLISHKMFKITFSHKHHFIH